VYNYKDKYYILIFFNFTQPRCNHVAILANTMLEV